MSHVAAWLRRRLTWRVAGVVIAAAVVLAIKPYYRHASAGDLSWILAPTAWLVSLVTGFDFAFESGTGWVSHEATYIIEPSCAGVNFLLAAFVALVVAWLPGMRSAATTARRVLGAFAAAFAATLVVNSLRLAIAIAMHRGTIDLGDMDRAQVHRIEGIIVYLGGLCALYALARRVGRRSEGHALAR